MRPPSPPRGKHSGRAMRISGTLLGLFLLTAPAPDAIAQNPSVIFAGFEHQPTGAATLEVDGAFGSLTIDALDGGVTYSLDAEGGSIRFGNGISGQRPPSGSWNMEAGYRVGGGSSAGVYGFASTSTLDLSFDYGPVSTNLIRGTISQQGQLLLDTEFPPFVTLIVLEWPNEVSLSIEDGEMVTVARWDAPVPIVLPDQSSLPCDEAVFRSQTGGALAGQELGKMNWRGVGLSQVQFLGERFLTEGDWFEVSGNLLLTRLPQGHELTHVVQSNDPGSYVEFPPGPCLGQTPSVERQTQGIAIEELVLQAEPEIGTRVEYFEYMQLPNQGRTRIPTHSAEWTDHNIHDPGVSMMGGFAELGAMSYTLQVFDDGLLVDTESGLPLEVARASEFVLQHNQTDLDFLRGRASAQLDLGRDVEILVMAATPRTVMGDRIHIIPEQLQLFPDCIEAVGMTIHRFGDLTLKRGVINAALPPALVFGLMHEATGDAVMQVQNGQLIVANDAWGPGAPGPLTGGVRTPLAGLQGYRWELAGNLDPQQLPPNSRRSYRLNLMGGLGGPGNAGLEVAVQNGRFAIWTDFAALGSSGAQVDAYLGSQRVYTGVMSQQGRILVDADYNEVEFEEDDQGIVSFELGWDVPQLLDIAGQSVTADRISERLRHRDRAITIWDYERLVLDSPATEVHKARVRPAGAWLSAVGGVRFGDFTQIPLLLEHLDLTVSTGVEVEAEEDPQGNAYVQLDVQDPASIDPFDGDERWTLRIQEEDEDPISKLNFAPGFVMLEPDGVGWKVEMNFLDAGYSGFRVEVDGFGELHSSSSPIGAALVCEAWPTTQIITGVGDELKIRLGFATPTVIDTPAKTAVVSSGLTLVVVGAGRPPFGAGNVQFLAQGLPTTALLASPHAVGVPEDGGGSTPRLSRSVALEPAVPNPFNPRTLLRYRLTVASNVVLAIYDVTGRKVRTLIEGAQPAGAGSVVWEGDDDRGRAVASGSYLVQIRTQEGTAQEKIALVR